MPERLFDPGGEEGGGDGQGGEAAEGVQVANLESTQKCIKKLTTFFLKKREFYYCEFPYLTPAAYSALSYASSEVIRRVHVVNCIGVGISACWRWNKEKSVLLLKSHSMQFMLKSSQQSKQNKLFINIKNNKPFQDLPPSPCSLSLRKGFARSGATREPSE